MATIIQLSETLYLNLDTVTVLRYDEGTWLVFFHDADHACRLTEAETAVLGLYLRSHIARGTYAAWLHTQQESTPS